ncbi:hypothetical protein [Amycolatopsis regifaucium]|uniref:Uncharacterized protein n=1 Tax=Amycolatopsis regifaucium TaxID=546365 RepID=A0A154MWH9_9PSEU|nr:hypothetical protein [Amycolatopsis regifaucium]KZB88652.1 hypothetical protein AVL48_00810 [Amycolatopsis regifaucium]OKA07178.1 hypothetical protein ATP06_0214980 [Amycolatopsis regifaucium]SFI55151.1 hypothetical protein SAMN04489731_111160 [Amycolatopsis regifaucium]
MMTQRLWLGLAVVYTGTAVVQLYLLVSTGAVWAGTLTAAGFVAAFSCAFAAWKAPKQERDGTREVGSPRR